MDPVFPAIGVGASGELSLRASVATLVKVLFINLEDSTKMLALERTATLLEIQGKSDVIVQAKPFGGGVRLINPNELMRLIGRFNYDSDRSRQEGDFRIHIHPAAWEKVKEVCLDHYFHPDKGIFDSSPEREIAEEFWDTLHVSLTKNQYSVIPREMIVEDIPVKTANLRAIHMPTVRIYYVFEARIESPEIIAMLQTNSKQYTDEDLRKLAWQDARQGGRGRANAILTARVDRLTEVYQSLSLNEQSGPVFFEEHQLDGNVLAILEEVDQTRYLRYIK